MVFTLSKEKNVLNHEDRLESHFQEKENDPHVILEIKN